MVLVLAASLISYKSASGLRTLEGVRASGTLSARADVVPLHAVRSDVGSFRRSINYFGVVWPALLFGILISGAVRAGVSPDWLVGVLSRRPAGAQFAAGLAGAPLMLCSCCVAPIFSAAYERSRRLGPSLALMFAAPALNPAALMLTFMLFPMPLAWGRLLLGVTAVFFATALMSRLLQALPVDPQQVHGVPPQSTGGLSFLTAFLQSCLHVTVRTVPPILVGIATAMLIADWLPLGAFASSASRVGTIALIAFLAVPVALPTFFEIPIGLTLLAGGAPAGAALAVLFAGPVINLPSLLTVARSAGWKVAAAAAAAVWLLAFVGGLFVG